MLEAAQYSALESLADGRHVTIRALKPDDRDGLIAAVQRSSAQSLYRRFFGLKRHFSDQEISFFLNIDFVDHVALVAVIEEAGQPVIIGGARYIMQEAGKAEIAFAVVDQYRGEGLAPRSMCHLAGIARAAGLKELTAEVLPDNKSMLKVFEKSGLHLKWNGSPGGASHFTAVTSLRCTDDLRPERERLHLRRADLQESVAYFSPLQVSSLSTISPPIDHEIRPTPIYVWLRRSGSPPELAAVFG